MTLRVSAVSVARTAVVSGSDGRFGQNRSLLFRTRSGCHQPTPMRGACNNANAQGPLLVLVVVAGRVYTLHSAYTPGLADR